MDRTRSAIICSRASLPHHFPRSDAGNGVPAVRLLPNWRLWITSNTGAADP